MRIEHLVVSGKLCRKGWKKGQRRSVNGEGIIAGHRTNGWQLGRLGKCRRWGGWITETFVLLQRCASGERLAALEALDLHATVGVHTLVSTQIWKLSVGLQKHQLITKKILFKVFLLVIKYLEANFALEGLHRRMDVSVLFKTRWRGKRFAALGTSVRTRAHVVGPDMSLEIARIGEDFRAIFAVVFAVFSVGNAAMLDQAESVRVAFWAIVTNISVLAVAVLRH